MESNFDRYIDSHRVRGKRVSAVEVTDKGSLNLMKPAKTVSKTECITKQFVANDWQPLTQ